MSSLNEVTSEGQQELLTIFVTTLTGKTFEVKVSPQDNIKSIKSQIQKTEGIPISHQCLLFNWKELLDSSCVTEPSIALHDGATIKLVLSMRGGPISLVHQPPTLNRTMLKNLMKFNRESITDDLPPGCKMAILILRVGDEINLLHFIDDGDHLWDSLPDYKDNQSLNNSLEGENSEENSITNEKVCDLKEKMGKLSLHRKSLKAPCMYQEVTKKAQNAMQPIKISSLSKLPAINQHSPGELFKSRSEFSQVPVLPDIVCHSLKNNSKDLEFRNVCREDNHTEISNDVRPKSCPASFIRNQIYKVFSESSYQDSLQITQPHFRSCVSACTSKLHYEWGESKTCTKSIGLLPPISDMTSLMNNNMSRNTCETRKVIASTVSSLNKLDVHNKYLCNNAREKQLKKNIPQSSVRKKSLLQTENENSFVTSQSDIIFNGSSQLNVSNSKEFCSNTSKSATYMMPLLSSDILKTKRNTNSLASQLENKKLNVEKKNKLKCSKCKKRLTLINTFECRCGFLFCVSHRYPETHQCSHDFRKESQNTLLQASHSTLAPKLPKI